MNRLVQTVLAAPFALSVAAFASAQTSAATSAQASPPNPPSHEAVASQPLAGFAKKAAVGGMAEVELGKLALQKASNDRVKQFGQRMIDDHSKANDELRQAAGSVGIDVPAQIDAKSQATIDKLSKLSGPAFDKAYMSDMVKDHEHDVAEFEKASKESASSPIKDFAEKTLPTLKDHLKMARDVDQEVSGRTASKS